MILSNPKPANTQQKQQRVGVSGIFHVPGCPVCVCLCFPSLHAQCHAADVFALRAQALLRAQHLNIPDLTHGASHLLTSTLNRGVSSPSSHGCNACKIVCVCVHELKRHADMLRMSSVCIHLVSFYINIGGTLRSCQGQLDPGEQRTDMLCLSMRV